MENKLEQKQFIHSTITMQTMLDEFNKAKAQQQSEDASKPSFEEFKSNVIQKAMFDMAFNEMSKTDFSATNKRIFKPENGRRIFIQENIPKKVAASAKIVGRANEDYISVQKLDYSLKDFSDEEIGQSAFNSIKILNKIIADANIVDGSMGATLTACVMVCNAGEVKIFTIQIGDSCVVSIGETAERLAVRQTIEIERERIESEAGKNSIFTHKNTKYVAGIGVARAIGYNPKKKGIVDLPNISYHKIEQSSSLANYLILTSDGFYSGNSTSFLFGLKNESADIEEYAKKICALSYKTSSSHGNQNIDDTIATILNLNEIADGDVYCAVVADGNSKDSKANPDNYVALKACQELHVCLLKALNEIASLRNNSNQSFQPASKLCPAPEFNLSIESTYSAYNASTDNSSNVPSQNITMQEASVEILEKEIQVKEGWLIYKSDQEESSQEHSQPSNVRKRSHSNSQTTVLYELNNANNQRAALKSSGDCSDTDVADEGIKADAQNDYAHFKHRIALVSPSSTPISSPKKLKTDSLSVQPEKIEDDSDKENYVSPSLTNSGSSTE